jgi:FkbM family methyltransferase
MSIQSVITTVRDLKRVMDRPSKPGLSRSGVASTYFKLRFLGDSSSKRKQMKILDYVVNYPDRKNLFLLFQDIFLKRIYEMNIDKEKPVIIDCGSNIGLSVLFFNSYYPHSKILAFEAHPKFFKILNDNIQHIKLTNVTTHQKALSNETGSIEFYENDQANQGSLNMGIIQREDDAICITVEADLLSNYITEEVDLLKLDIEGAEENVITDLLRSGKIEKIRNMVCEYHHHIADGIDRLSNTLKMLEEAGFGYQLSGYCLPPPRNGAYQDIMIYAFRKD